ncbi:hypothetical protein MHC_03945 [Mycoplasma haemocanis str. Illinois]|uniref:Uncharacterized protein n=1 Tax=Mycoplasma haemocanis (strain Illinois) TaxID=1111676 RepID=H6N7M5_MYCHN|nr:hypothetical protein [Mycoplasma haemocanis]AEW45647.1 hypothetical protein MHC_03945 [Mycoplasma haemocanis str. Illinois]
MPLITSKLLKVGGPILTGIGGVIATSSLISKSAEEKPEEKLKTKALADEDPKIKEWKDRDESDGNQGEGGANSSEESAISTNQSDQEGSTSNNPSSQGATESSDDDDDEKGEEDNSSKEGDNTSSTTGDGKTEEDSEGEQKPEGSGVTDSGSEDANHNNALGNAYGNIDRAMTAHEVEKTKQLKSNLEGLLGDLKGLVWD